MKTHFEHLLDVIPDLASRKILDLGSGRGSFLIDCSKKGAIAEGLELNKEYIEKSLSRAKEARVSIKVSQGIGEELSFQDGSFDFINMCEVIEHVNNPEKVLSEVYRVLKPGGKVYVSVPNRFGLKDQHFGLYFVNWMPRSWSSKFISVFGKHKDYKGDTGHQRLEEMHYYTYGQVKTFFDQFDFTVIDIRQEKINKMSGIKKIFTRAVYRFLKPWYFDSFHVLLIKK